MTTTPALSFRLAQFLRGGIVVLTCAVLAATLRTAGAAPASYSSTQFLVLPRNSIAVDALHAAGYATAAVISGTDWRVMRPRSGQTVDAALTEVAARSDVVSAQPDYLGKLLGTTPNDPFFSSQYHLAITRCTEAWDYSQGSSSETIAVVDSGGDTQHLDLASKVVFAPGIDILEGDNDPSEPVTGTGHATNVAGTATAITNNGTDASGVDWNARVLFIRVADVSGGVASSHLASGLRKAVDNKASVINLSLGWDTTTVIEIGEEALLYALHNRIPVIAAAGNSGATATPVAWPANSRFAFAVGASTGADTRASFSSYGAPTGLTGIDIVAPGDGITTLSPGGSVESVNGTSFAAPIVSGAVAMMRAFRPEYTPANIYYLLQFSSKDLGPSGYDSQTGWGRLNMSDFFFWATWNRLYPFANDTAGVRVDSFVYSAGEERTASSSPSGRHGRRALLLTADNDYAAYGTGLQASAGTIEFYFMYTGSQPSDTRFILTQKGNSARSKGNIDLILTSDSRLQYSLAESGTISSTTRLNPNQWYHIALLYGWDSMYLAVNGVFETGIYARGGPPVSDTVYLGAPTSLSGAKCARGRVESLRFSFYPRYLFPSALTARIVNVYNPVVHSMRLQWEALQNDTTSATVNVYVDRDSVGFDGTLIASNLSNDGSEVIPITNFLSLGDTFFVYIVVTDSTYTDEKAYAYSDTTFAVYNPITIIKSQSVSSNACLLAQALPADWCDLVRPLRDHLLSSQPFRFLVEAYYRLSDPLRFG